MASMHMFHTQALEALFDKPIAYHPVFARITKSVKAGIFLSQAFYWAPRTSDPDRWFYKVQEEWEEETCLTRREQETAREKLRELGILEEALRDMPAKLYFRLNYERLIETLNDYALQDGGKCHTRMAESAKHGCTKQPHMVAQNSHTITESTTESTTKKKETSLREVKKVARTPTSIPGDFSITDQMRSWFATKRFPFDIDDATEEWRDSMGKNTQKYRYTDWHLAWQSGMRQRAKWEAERPAYQRSQAQKDAAFRDNVQAAIAKVFGEECDDETE